MVEHIHVQLTLSEEAGERQVAAAQVADDGVYRIITEQQVELRVQRVTQKELDDDFLVAELGSANCRRGPLVRVGRYAPIVSCWRSCSANRTLRRCAVWLSMLEGLLSEAQQRP